MKSFEKRVHKFLNLKTIAVAGYESQYYHTDCEELCSLWR